MDTGLVFLWIGNIESCIFTIFCGCMIMSLTYNFMKLLGRVSCSLSEKNAQRMGNYLGVFFWMLVPPKRKKLAINNIIRCGITDNEKEASRISKAAAVRFGDIGVSMFRFPLLNQDNIKKYVTIERKA